MSSVTDSFADNLSKLDEVIKNLESDLKTVKGLAKEIKKNYNTDVKKNGTKKTKKTESNGDKKTYGITEPKVLPPNVYEFIKYALTNKKLAEDFVNNNNDIFKDFTTETLVARTKVNSIIHNYIKSNNLYVDEEKRSAYKPDAKLKELFEMKNEEELNLKNIQTFLKRAYDKFKTDDQKNINKKQKQKKEDEVEVEDEDEDETENDSE
jgi:hypothetical protein